MRRTLIVLVLLMTVLPTLAQEADVPPAALNAAFDAAENALGTRSENYRFQVLGRTTSSTLGCPLVEGEMLPYEVTPYRIELVFPDGIYVVHVSADGRFVQLCDSKFGEAMTNPVPAEDACVAVPNAAASVLLAPSEAVSGVLAANPGEEYRVYGRSADAQWVQVGAGQGVGWIKADEVALNGDCSGLVAVGFTAPDFQGPTCFVSALGAFTNVRAQPNVDAARVAQIYENSQFQATARNTNGDWYYIQGGWVASWVLQTLGDCAGLPANDSLVGAGFSSAGVPDSLDESVSAALAQFPCPADFAGYMEPRVQVGIANAQVEVGGVPNALRSFPSVDDAVGERLGTIQPGRTIDRILSGPVCNQGFVWWLVEFDGQTGWTAESNASSQDYYLEPLGGEVPSDESRTAGTLDRLQVNAEPVTALLFSPDGARLFSVGSAPGFGDGENGFVQIWNAADGTEQSQILLPDAVLGIDWVRAENALAVGNSSGGVTLYDPQETSPIRSLEGLYDPTLPHMPQFVFSADGTQLAVTGCTDASCGNYQVSVFDATSGSLIWQQSIGVVEIVDLAFSPDDRLLAIATTQQVLFLRTGDGGLAFMHDNPNPLYAIAFRGDGLRLLAAGCQNADCTGGGALALLDATTGSALGIAVSHDQPAQMVMYAPDGQSLASSDGAQEVILRDGETGEARQTIRVDASDGTITSFTYTPDGAQIVVGTSAGYILFFEVAD